MPRSYRQLMLGYRDRQRQHERAARTRAALQLSAQAAATYRFDRIYLHGSTLQGPLSAWSDIDMVVEGLPDRDFYSLAGFLCSRSTYVVDLRPYESLSADCRKKLEAKGVVVYDGERSGSRRNRRIHQEGTRKR